LITESTLADRLGAIKPLLARQEKSTATWQHGLERERGITIKSHAIQMEYTYKGEEYIELDWHPGHVDFLTKFLDRYCSSRRSTLIVDAAQSIQAQTISNLYLALENDLEIIRFK
jgi:GTP-binding protein LepA